MQRMRAKKAASRSRLAPGHRRPSCAPGIGEQLLEAVRQGQVEAGDAGTLEAQRGHRHRPARMQWSEHGRTWDAGVGEEELGEGLGPP